MRVCCSFLRWTIRAASRVPTAGLHIDIPFFGKPWRLSLLPQGKKVDSNNDWTGKLCFEFGPHAVAIPEEGIRVGYTLRLIEPKLDAGASLRKGASVAWTKEEKGTYVHQFGDGKAALKAAAAAQDTYAFELELTLLGDFVHNTNVRQKERMERARFAVLDDLASLLSSERLSDVVLRCGDTEFPAHRAILSARSPIFKAMFEHKMAEATDGVVELEDMAADVARELLRFIYSGQCDLERKASVPEAEEGKEGKEAKQPAAVDHDTEWPCKLYAAAHRFQVATLLALLEDALCSDKVTAQSFLPRLLTAERFGISKLKQRCVDFLRQDPKNGAAVMASPDFAAISREDLLVVMACIVEGQVPALPKVGKKRSREEAGLDDGVEEEGAESSGAGAGPALTVDRVRSLRVEELKRELAARGLSRLGLKADLVLRLENALRGQ